jgi:phospho-N-acetylmuramoyl-pentapeptide-transferase
MLYHLLAPLADKYILFNLFNYISFRAAGAMLTALLFAFLVGPSIIARLRAKKIGQVVRSEGLASHQGKRGTPTMGGLIILLAVVIGTLLWAPLNNRFVVVALLATLWTGAIGFLDDYLKIVEGKSRGLVAKWKLAGQCTFGIALGLYLLNYPVVLPDTLPAAATTVPFIKYTILQLAPWLYVAFVTLVITGSSNAVNMTDGLDGLAAGLTAIAAAAFAFFAYVFGRVDTTSYLQFYYLPGSGELTVFCAALMGASLGFLWFNAHPAQVFMGDTGALAIGGGLGTVSILLKAEFLLLIIGGVFVAEQVSVMLQMGVYKWFKRTRGREYADAHRVFRMAPLHHHFEKKGWAETTVVTRFYILGILCALLALATLKLR